MKDIRVMSGTYSQLLPTSCPPYFKHSFVVRDDQSMVVLYCRKKEHFHKAVHKLLGLG